jgi:dTDP-glucose 4,6-dehydratase
MRGLGWQPQTGFTEGLRRTVEWYLGHSDWWRKLIEKKNFQSHLRKNYE